MCMCVCLRLIVRVFLYVCACVFVCMLVVCVNACLHLCVNVSYVCTPAGIIMFIRVKLSNSDREFLSTKFSSDTSILVQSSILTALLE